MLVQLVLKIQRWPTNRLDRSNMHEVHHPEMAVSHKTLLNPIAILFDQNQLALDAMWLARPAQQTLGCFQVRQGFVFFHPVLEPTIVTQGAMNDSPMQQPMPKPVQAIHLRAWSCAVN